MNKQLPYKTHLKCICCDNPFRRVFLDLRDQPLSNEYLKTKDIHPFIYPLKLTFCPVCTHVQLDTVVIPDIIHTYPVVKDTLPKTLKNYYESFINVVKAYTDKKKLLEIFCDDPSRLQVFKDDGYDVSSFEFNRTGSLTSTDGYDILPSKYSIESLENFDNDYEIIIIHNYFANTHKPVKLLQKCKEILAPGGHIFIRMTGADAFHNYEFDVAHHERISYYSIRSFYRVIEKAGLKLVDVRREQIEGTSFLFVISKEGPDNSLALIRKEPTLSFEKLSQLASITRKRIFKLNLKIDVYRKMNYIVVGYGLNEKINTFLNFAEINLDYIVTKDESKCGLFTSSRKTPIKHPSSIGKEVAKVLVVILDRDYMDDIIADVKEIREDGVRFLTYHPEVEII